MSRAERLLIGAVLVAAALVSLATLGGLSWLDDRLSDQRFELTTRPASSSIVMVDIDAKSLATIGVWPWDRTIHARLVEQLEDLGARQIAFDIDFSARSNPAADTALSKAIATARVPVFLAAFVQKKAADAEAFLLSRPIDLLADGWPALVNVPIDPDGRVRQFPAQMMVNGERLDAMPALIAGAVSGGAPVIIDYSIDQQGIAHVSASDVLYGRVGPDVLAGKTVLMGAAALELHDYFLVPRWGMVTGVDIVALASETLIQGRGLSHLPTLPLVLPLLALALLASLLPTRLALPSLVLLALATEAVAAGLQVSRALVAETASLHVGVVVLLALVLIREYDLRGVLLRGARLEKANADRILGRVFDNGFDGIIIIDEDDRIVRHNLSSSGFLAGAGADEPTLAVLPERLRQAVAEVRASAETGQSRSCIVDVEQAEGDEAVILECAVTAFGVERPGFRRGTAVGYACITLRNVTERRRAAERVRHMALHDALTGLMNRAGLLEAMQGAGTLICFDIVRFGKINDWLGNAVGDKVLVDLSRRVSDLALADSSLARIGSDEFAVFLHGEGRPADATIEAIRATLALVFRVNGHRLFVDVDFGVAEGHDGADLLLRHANLALAKARDSKGVVIYDASLESERKNRLALEEELRLAIEREELTAYYQPQVALGTQQIIGAEMLVRWTHPERGMIPPSEFIPIAEETGLIHKLTAWALRQACLDAAAWPTPLRIAVNVSAIDLRASNIHHALQSALDMSGLAADRLDIELTESFLLERTDAVNCTLTDIRSIGVGIALDDFGTGYSSLAYLSRLPFTKLKMDKAFVDDIATSRDALALAEGIIRLAHSLRLKVVAEGIETAEQRDALERLGCDIGQGYLFAKPMPQRKMLELLGEAGVKKERVG